MMALNGGGMQASINAKELLNGTRDINTFADLPCCAIKLYICSTGTDMRQEQRCLYEQVYPQLREFCRYRLGRDFHAVDMKFGEAGNIATKEDFQIRLGQIQECQRSLFKPSFVAFLGHRYGDCPLPDAIDQTTYEFIRLSLGINKSRDTKDAAILDDWYLLDLNFVEPVYILQTSSTKSSSADDDVCVKSLDDETRGRIRYLLSKGLELSIKNGNPIGPDQLLLLSSEFERELRQGILREGVVYSSFLPYPQPISCKSTSLDDFLVFERIISDLKNYATHPVTKDFAEVATEMKVGANEVIYYLDEVSKKKLDTIKEKCLAKIRTSNNNICHSILFKYDDCINRELHKSYLNDVCSQFYYKATEMIEASVANCSPIFTCPYLEDIYQHWVIAARAANRYIENEETMAVLRSYVISNDCLPLVVSGDTGLGKTSLLATVASQVSEWLSPTPATTVVRFIATTSTSFNIGELLWGICYQITLATCNDVTTESVRCIVPQNYDELEPYFCRILEEFPSDRTLVIILDSVHLLSQQHNAHCFNWLPSRLKENVKLVLSIQPGDQLEFLRTQLITNTNNFLTLPLFTSSESEMLLADSLPQGRVLTEEQMHYISARCFTNYGCDTGAGFPLYIRMIAGIVSDWSSFSPAFDCAQSLPINFKEAIHRLFDDVEARCGGLIVQRALSFLTASMRGLSDCELEDVLSMDKTAMEFACGRLSVPLEPRHMPPLHWARIKYWLRPYLTCLQCEGSSVYTWRHHVFADVTRERYLNTDVTRHDVHSLLADYWMGKEEDQEQKAVSNGLDRCQEAQNLAGKKYRLVPLQPLAFGEEGCGWPHLTTPTSYNRRKLHQLPLQLYLAGRFDELDNCVLFRFAWLIHKAKAFSLEAVIADLALSKSTEARLIRTALRDAAPFICESIDNMAPELTGRLLSYNNTRPAISALIRDADISGARCCALLPVFPYRQIPAGALKNIVDCTEAPTQCFLVGRDADVLFTKNRTSHIVEVINLKTGKRQKDVDTSVGDLFVSPSGGHALVSEYSREKYVKVHRMSDGEVIGTIVPVHHIEINARDKHELISCCLSDSFACLTLYSVEQSWLCIASLASSTITQIVHLRKRPTILAMSPDGQTVFTNDGTAVVSFSMTSMSLSGSSPLKDLPTFIIVTRNSARVFVVEKDSLIIRTAEISRGSINHFSDIELFGSISKNDSILDVCLSKNEQLLLARTRNHISIYDLNFARHLCGIERPPDLVREFRLPRTAASSTTGGRDADFSDNLTFVAAHFIYEDSLVAAAVFRDVYVWKIGAHPSIVAILHTPVGLIRDVFVTGNGNIVTVAHGSKQINVWSLTDTVDMVNALDRMTSSVSEIVVTKDDSRAFVKCTGSDEIGVVDLNSGRLIHLLTHESTVHSFSVSVSGRYLFVSLEQARPSRYNKVWDVEQRLIIFEFGDVAASCTPYGSRQSEQACSAEGDTVPPASPPANCSDGIDEEGFMVFLQMKQTISEPFRISRLRLLDDASARERSVGRLEMISINVSIEFLVQQPFLTPTDRYLIAVSADGYDSPNQRYLNPTICAISMLPQSNPPTSTDSALGLVEPPSIVTRYSPDIMREAVPSMQRVLSVRPCLTNPFSVMILYTNEPDIDDEASNDITSSFGACSSVARDKCGNDRCRSRRYQHNYGFLIWDVCAGVVCQILDDFLLPSTPLDKVLFTRDLRMCIDHESNVYDMATGFWVANFLTRTEQASDGETCCSPISAKEQRGLRETDSNEKRDGKVMSVVDKNIPRALLLTSHAAVYADGEYVIIVRLSDRRRLAKLSVHSCISSVQVCHDERTIVIGCEDGSIVSYIFIDSDIDDVTSLQSGIPTRQVASDAAPDNADQVTGLAWDHATGDKHSSRVPQYSRPPSTELADNLMNGKAVKEKIPAGRGSTTAAGTGRQPTSSQLYNMRSKSEVCIVM